ncbi:hypothetical protein ScPMuIL_000993 [Solemya velum]
MADSDMIHINNEPSAEAMCAEYAQYIITDSSKEQEKFHEAIDEMLTKLDEFGGLVDMIRSDTTLCLNKTLPEIQQKSLQMQKIFDRVDKMEAFVGVVRHNIANMEDVVSKAEDDLGSLSGIKKMLSSFVSPKRTKSKGKDQKCTYEPVDIFSTQTFFQPTTPSNKPEQSLQTARTDEEKGATETGGT